MHRILLAGLVGVLSCAVQAQEMKSVAKADGTSKLGTNWSWEAQTRIRNEIHENPAGTTGGSLSTRDYQFTEQKTTLGLNFDRGEDFKGRIGLVHAFNWGDNGASNGSQEFNTATSANGNSQGGVASPRGIGDQQNLFLVNEAWLWWAFGNSLSVKAGRSQIELGDQKVVSSNKNEITPTSFDGAKIYYDHEALLFRGFALRAFDGFNPRNPGTQGLFKNDAETNIFGLAIDFRDMPKWFSTFNFHYLKVFSDGQTGSPLGEQTSDRFSANMGGTIWVIDYDISVGHHQGSTTTSGTDVDTSGTMLDGKLGWASKSLFNSYLYVGYHFDSGDEDGGTTDGKLETYDPFFYDRHANAGFMDVVEWGNLSYFYAGAGVTIYELDIKVDYFDFRQSDQLTASNLGINGAFLAGGAGTATAIDNDSSKDLGSELDASISYKFDSGLRSAVRFSMFFPGEEFGTGNTESYSLTSLEGEMTF